MPGAGDGVWGWWCLGWEIYIPAAAARAGSSWEALNIPLPLVRWNEGVGVRARPMETVRRSTQNLILGLLAVWLRRNLALELVLSPLTWGLASLF